MIDMTNKTALVTGGSTGIGRAICECFLEQGYQVVNLARRALELDHDQLHNISVDLSDVESTRSAAQEAAEKFNISTLVHNAGLIRPALLEDVAIEDLDYLAHIHIGAAISLTQAVLPAMKQAKFGRVILITSRAALGLETRTNYSATKAGMMGMARTWALELGKYGITVNTVAPGPIEATEMFHNVIPEGDPKIQKIADSIPVKRVGTPADVANAVNFLASPQSGFITGQTLMVCGGASLGALSL